MVIRPYFFGRFLSAAAVLVSSSGSAQASPKTAHAWNETKVNWSTPARWTDAMPNAAGAKGVNGWNGSGTITSGFSGAQTLTSSNGNAGTTNFDSLSLTQSEYGSEDLSGASSSTVNAGKLVIGGDQIAKGQFAVIASATLLFGNGTSSSGSSVNPSTIFVDNTTLNASAVLAFPDSGPTAALLLPSGGAAGHEMGSYHTIIGATNTSGTITCSGTIVMDWTGGENRPTNVAAAMGRTGSPTNTISGLGQGLTEVDGLTVIPTGASTYPAATAVSLGKLVIGVFGGGVIISNVTVASGSTVSGSGTVTGN